MPKIAFLLNNNRWAQHKNALHTRQIFPSLFMNSPVALIIGGMSKFFLGSLIKLLLVAASLIILFLISIGLTNYFEKIRVQAIEVSQAAKINPHLLAHELIDLEVKIGIAEEPELAHKKVTAILNKAKSTITINENPTTEDVLQFFSAIGRLLGNHFYYERNTTFTQGLREQGLDCDLRSHLYHSIAEQAGLKISVISSPGHAFIGWKGEGDNENVYWETTSRYGHRADLGKKGLYKDSNDPADYKFSTVDETKDQYSAWIYRKTFTQTKDPSVLDKLLDLSEKRRDFGFIQVQKTIGLAEDIGYDHPKIKKLSESLIDRTGNFGERMLIHYYEQAGDYGAVKNYLHQIKTKDYSSYDYLLASKTESLGTKKILYFLIGLSYAVVERSMEVVGEKVTWEINAFFWFFTFMLTIAWSCFAPGLRFFKVSNRNHSVE